MSKKMLSKNNNVNQTFKSNLKPRIPKTKQPQAAEQMEGEQ